MIRSILFFLLLPFCLFAEWDQLFSSDEDPTVFHHVNVMSGHLTLSVEDTKLEGAEGVSLMRTYSSSGALEKTRHSIDLMKRAIRGGWLIQGGWNFLPHTNLQIFPGQSSNDLKLTEFRLQEPSGAGLSYFYSHKEKASKHTYHYFYKPKKRLGPHTGVLSSRNDPQNNVLRVELDTHHPRDFKVVVLLPSGGKRFYERLSKTFENSPSFYYYKLLWETLPSGRHVKYVYDARDKLIDIKAKKPDGTTYAWIHLDHERKNHSFPFKATTSDRKAFLYSGIESFSREYLSEAISSSKKREVFHYSKGGEELGSHISEILFEDNLEVKVHYYSSSKSFLGRDEEYYKKHFEIEKVQSLEAPVGPNGELQTIATFTYKPGLTEATDVEGAITRYLYQDDKILRIERFDPNGRNLSILEFIWGNKRLIAKVLSDASGRPIFSKTFAYDTAGNVIEETLWGQLTGLADKKSFRLTPESNGRIVGAEHYSKTYEYESESNLLIYESEEIGLSYRYKYKPGTDLLLQKLTLSKDSVLKREFSLYDDDHCLICEIVDDGCSSDLNDLSGVTQRQIKRYAIDNATGLVLSISYLYLDLSSGSEILIKKHVYGYDEHHLRNKEEVYDALGGYRYTLTTEYGERGKVVFQTTPLGGVNTYRYNTKGHLEETKEVGQPRKIYEHDAVGRALSCREIDDEGNSKISYASYDAKGNIVSQTDVLGNVTEQYYDTLGKCIQTNFPQTVDDAGNVYTPKMLFTYDACGNLTSHTNSKEETTQTAYNVFQNPTVIVRADGTVLEHIYNRNGTLAKTIEPDLTETHYSYDPFLRATSKKIYSAKGRLLSEEFWSYDTFRLLSHTDINGLVTTFFHDDSGKKISESSDGRVTSYSYDALGFIESTTSGDFTKVEIHDVAGNIIKKWEKKGSSIENQTTLHYNVKGLLEQAERVTSQGIATDLFTYDAEGRLCHHTDPKGNETQFLHYPISNTLGQWVFCKVTVNALGYKTIETDDATNRLVAREKQDEYGKTLSYEEFFYDLAGNKTKRLFTVYLKDSPTKKILHLSEYDSMGRVIKEIEAGKKVTTYSYDAKGRLLTKTLPSGICLTYEHDGIGRLLSLKSSDHTIDYLYGYEKGPDPIWGKDLLSNLTISRKYNSFNEIEKEIHPKWTLFWEYDDLGRIISHLLPDGSSIAREYKGGHLKHVIRKDSYNTPLYAHTYLKTDPNGHIEEEKLIYSVGIVQTSHDLLERPLLQSSTWNTHQVSYDCLGRVDSIKSSLFKEKEISYDPLNQLTKEGEKSYLFDSIGNSSFHEVSMCNEVLSTSDSTLSYDLDGNLIERTLSDQKTLYTYDALGRLTSIVCPGHKKITYSYDAFSRLFSKKTSFKEKTDKVFFLYDQDKEIGTVNESGKILELKVLGLGLQGDIGAAVAIELGNKVYAPLHDFSGNCIALIDSSKNLFEMYQIEAFGKEISTPPSPKNPWRFASKRQEENLVFFGIRFYDLALERWLTPDPSGFADGPNLYSYALNSPLNRLDLFGLNSFDLRQPQPMMEMQIASLNLAIVSSKPVTISAISVDGARVDYTAYCGFWHQMQFSATEVKTGKINLLEHFAEIMPHDGKSVALISFQNGINTSFKELGAATESIIRKIPEGTLVLGMHNRSVLTPWDAIRTLFERKGVHTFSVKHTSQMMGAIVNTIHKINPEMIWVHIPHSEGGVVGRRAIERLTSDQKQICKDQLYNISIAPAQKMPVEYGFAVYNLYSKKDGITGRWANEQDGLTYNVKMLDCLSPLSERTLWFADHRILGPTYQKGLDIEFGNIRQQMEFYNGNTR